MTSTVLDAPPRLSVYDVGSAEFQTAPRQVADYLARKGLTSKYGFQLLHEHFPLEHEAIVQAIKNNELDTRVVPRHEADGLMPTIWRVTPDGVFPSDGTLIPMQWAEGVAASTIVDSDLEEFGHFLAAAGLASTFVIVDLAYTIQLGPDQVSLEYTDEVTRTQRTIAVPRSTVTEAQAATWVATSDGSPVVRGVCQLTDNKH